MSLLDTGRYNSARTRNIAPCVRLCEVGEVRELIGKDNSDGKPRRDVTFIPLTLLEASTDTDGNPLPVGFPKEVGLNSYNEPGDDDGLAKANEITCRLFRQLVVAALDLPENCSDVHAEMQKQGGASSLKGKRVMVKFSAKNDRQNIDRISKAPKAA